MSNSQKKRQFQIKFFKKLFFEAYSLSPWSIVTLGPKTMPKPMNMKKVGCVQMFFCDFLNEIFKKIAVKNLFLVLLKNVSNKKCSSSKKIQKSNDVFSS